ncbi:NAD(P)H-dependent oxidoreductase [Plantibacter flavus]|uniref:FMN-dependent NADH-azoreductase n=1 Tax=Plantibacter flavus TaxID=150123 RepID=UPI003F14D5B5
MPTLLHLDSSADLTTSRSRRLSQAVVDAWLTADPTGVVVRRDLHRDPVPHLADSSLHWAPADRVEGSNPPAEAEELQRELVDELLAADIVVIGAPLYNFSIPSSLKAWIDHIHVPGVTSADTGSLVGRPVVITTSRGIAYDIGSPTEGWDHEVPALRTLFGGALGMDVHVITTSLTLAEREAALAPQIGRSEQELAEALSLATETGLRLAVATA